MFLTPLPAHAYLPSPEQSGHPAPWQTLTNTDTVQGFGIALDGAGTGIVLRLAEATDPPQAGPSPGARMGGW